MTYIHPPHHKAAHTRLHTSSTPGPNQEKGDKEEAERGWNHRATWIILQH
ncbi:unnamed protein product [Ectocarpus sp. CCAP 1310/34]|nr:unnamed protein product [Ectocarpus sp. CCAP 1310/34]